MRGTPRAQRCGYPCPQTAWANVERRMVDCAAAATKKKKRGARECLEAVPLSKLTMSGYSHTTLKRKKKPSGKREQVIEGACAKKKKKTKKVASRLDQRVGAGSGGRCLQLLLQYGRRHRWHAHVTLER